MGTPEYQRVIDEIVARIDSGQWMLGQALPSIAELAKLLSASKTTVKTALLILRQRGRIRGQQGKATYVADPPPSA